MLTSTKKYNYKFSQINKYREAELQQTSCLSYFPQPLFESMGHPRETQRTKNVKQIN